MGFDNSQYWISVGQEGDESEIKIRTDIIPYQMVLKMIRTAMGDLS